MTNEDSENCPEHCDGNGSEHERINAKDCTTAIHLISR
jgi:hypothetical protein